MLRTGLIGISAALLIGAGAARAAVVDAQAGGFQLRENWQVNAPPEKVWTALVDVGAWWPGSHTYSGNARNLTLQPRIGGCWCEALPGGGVEHMRVVHVAPNTLLRLSGGLGPLQAMGGTGALSIALAPKDGGTALTMTYVYGGYAPGGLAAMAAPVDAVMVEQFARLKVFAETGRAP